MLKRLALAFILGNAAGYILSRHYHRNEGEDRFNELMSNLPWFVLDGIDSHIDGEPMLTVTYETIEDCDG